MNGPPVFIISKGDDPFVELKKINKQQAKFRKILIKYLFLQLIRCAVWPEIRFQIMISPSNEAEANKLLCIIAAALSRFELWLMKNES